MASTSEESSLLTALETTTVTPIYSLFASYLSPFTDLTKLQQKQRKNPKKDQQQQKKTLTTTIRSLGSKYLQFLNKCLSILPKRLSNSSDLDESLAGELFDVYRLCLDCVELVSSQLSCKPWTIQVQRLRLVRCLEAAGKSAEGEKEGFRVLEKLRACGEFGGDKELALVAVEAVAVINKCVASGQSKDEELYKRVVALLEEIKPCFRVLDACAYEKLHQVLVAYLGKCALFLVAESTCFSGNLVRKLCLATLTEYAKFPMSDQIYKFARRLCSSLFLLEDSRAPDIIDLLICVLSSTAHACKVQGENNEIEFIELVSYCANKCRTACTIICSHIARHLIDIAGNLSQVMRPLDLILRLYATGLHFTSCDLKYQGGEVKEGWLVIKILADDGDGRYNLATLLNTLENYFHVDCRDNCVQSSVECKDSVNQKGPRLDSNIGTSLTCTQRIGKVYQLSYLSALKFFCQPLAELVHSEKKQILAEFEAASASVQLFGLQDVFHQFCDIFHFSFSFTSEREREGFDDNKTILSVAVAAFILSVSTNFKLQTSVHLIKRIIGSDWIQPQGLKYLLASLYNIGVLLYKNKQLKEAAKALKLSCKASWTCVAHHCQKFVHKSKGLQDDLSEEAIMHFVSETCARSAFLLDVLHQCGSLKVKKVVATSLENWSVAGNFFSTLPGSMTLVKQWVKIECKLHKHVDTEDNPSTLYCLLWSSGKVSKRTIGIILEQELLAYAEMSPFYPEISQRMQMKIIDILLGYVKVDGLQKSRILLRKGRALRARGIEGLHDCIQCLTEALSVMSSLETPPCHQLAAAYCLRALCNQEVEPNSKQILEDINAAISLWLSISIPDGFTIDDKCNVMSENTLILLYNVFDLLCMKGCIKFLHDIYELFIRLFKRKNVPLEKCLVLLWGCRRLSHALCVSPVNEAFIMKLSEHHGELPKSIDFWIHCFKGSQPLLVGFQQNFSFLFANFPHGVYAEESSFQLDIKVDDVKEAATELLVPVPVPSHSAFLAGYLYYDLCERLISNGRLFEALSYAKEAHRLRSQLFQEKFRYSIEKEAESQNESGETIEKSTYGIRNFQVFKSVADEVWSFDSISREMDSYYLSAWNVLQSYLESTLQLGILHELIGNGVEAETFLLWGKNISCSQSLPLFTVAFSSVLGKIYRKKQHWSLAEKELQLAKQILVNIGDELACIKCRLMLEASVNQQLGDLYRSHIDGVTRTVPAERLSHAQDLYMSALDKLNLSEWKNIISCPEKGCNQRMCLEKNSIKNVEYGADNACTNCSTNQLNAMKLSAAMEETNKKLVTRKCRTKNTLKASVKEKNPIPEQNIRYTRSMYRSSQNQSVRRSCEEQPGQIKHSGGDNISNCCSAPSQRESLMETKSFIVDLGSEVACICKNLKCWNCLPVEVVKSGMVNNFIHVKWEFGRRRLSLRILTCIGKCLGDRGQIHETHEIIMQSIYVLVSRNPFRHAYCTVPIAFILHLLGKQLPGDVFAVERAAILYSFSWFSVKNYHSNNSRIVCCDLSHVQLSKIVSWLKLAFVLCREVPILFQKVARLLAVIYTCTASSEQFSLSSSPKALSENYWASYFHQASVGTHLDYQFFSTMSQRCKTQNQGFHVTGSAGIGAETSKLLRHAPESIEDLEQFVTDFFALLPCTTVICISLLGGAYARLLREFLCYPSCVNAWMLLSRLNTKGQPIVVLLPVNSILEELSDDEETCGLGEISEGKHWHCPWGSCVVDDVAPAFRMILEENYLSSSVFPLEDTKKIRTLWWMQRKRLDNRLGKLLRKLEDLWLSHWRFLLTGEWSNCQHLDMVLKKVMHDLKSKCKVNANETLLKLILGGASAGLEQTCISYLPLKKCCYIALGDSDEERGGPLSNSPHGVDSSRLAFQILHEALNELQEDSVNREPIILVLDCEVQMLPWENIPILRNQEVYRMPSLASISVTLDRSFQHDDQVGVVAAFPLIDPLDAFYLLNPSGDLSSTQLEFENWFRDQNLEGKAGSAPTAEELAIALRSHDLFIYFGHGSGVQYISRHEIQKLEKCAATLLMGCSSGSLSLNGCYIPQGMPLTYLLGGSPVTVANLWEVTDKDIDRFGKAMLDSWLRERSSPVDCAQCNLVVKELEAMSIKGLKGNAKKKTSRKKLLEAGASVACSCNHRPKIGSFMSQAREACMLPFLIGASPVCYGVPTCIRRKKDH